MKNVPTLCLALAMHLPCSAAGVQLSLSPSGSTIGPGSAVSIDILATYSGPGKVLGGAVDLSFDARLLDLTSVIVLAPVDVSGSTGSLSVVGDQGMLSGLGFASFDGVSGAFKLATVEFRSRGPVGLSGLALDDAASPVYVWANDAAESLQVARGVGSILVAVPEPSAALTLALGWAAIVIAKRRRPAA